MTIPRVVTATVAVITTVATIPARVIVSPIVALIAATSASVLIVLITVVSTIALVVAALVVSTVSSPTVAIAAATIPIVILVVVVVVLAGSIVTPAILLRPVRRLRVMLLSVLLQLALLVVNEVIEYRHGVLEGVDDLQRLDSLRVGHLLGVARVCDGFVFVILQPYLPKLCIRHILHVDPAHLKGALPLVLGPHVRNGVVIHGRHHLRDTAEVSRPVHREEQIHHTAFLFAFAIRLIQPLVAVFGRAPDLVLDASVDVILRVGFDNEEPS